MTSVVIHYKELALKGRNRPWFVKILIRNLRTALADFDIRSIRSVMGRIEVDLGAATSWDAVSDRVRRVFGIANYSRAARAPHDFDALAAAILSDLGDRDAASFRVSARRADKRVPFTSPEIEREVGGRIKEVKGWRVDLDHAALTIHLEMMTDRRILFLREEAWRRRTADRHRRPCRVSPFGGHRFAGCRLPDDAARLLGTARSFSQLPDSLQGFPGEGARDRGAPHHLPASIAAAARALRRTAAAGTARRAARSFASSSIGA